VTVETKKKDPLEEPREAPKFDLDDPELTRFDLVREGARRDGVEIVHYAPRFPVPGTRAERRVVRTIALLFMITGFASTVFVVAYIWWPWEYKSGNTQDKLFTPILGLTLGVALLALGVGIIAWAKKLLPEEVAVQERHLGASPSDEQRLTVSTLGNLGEEVGVTRRPVLVLALAAGAAPLALVGGAAIVGALIKNPHRQTAGTKATENNPYFHTGWDAELFNDGKPVRLTLEDGTPIRPADVSVGGQITVFPGLGPAEEGGVPNKGATNEHADSPTLLIHLREDDARQAEKNAEKINQGSQWGNFVAYSKICTHAGCPASLYEQQTNRLLCPCHQSQFQISDNARPIFGPATRPLPQLPIELDSEGYFIAKSDYKVAVGPAFWERP
jgi:ubiquinol-cytochrome c reductase iron-sulfur subunit